MDIINWNKFCSTGNIKYLDFLSDNAKNTIKKNINKNVQYKGLQRILELYFNNSLNNIKHCNFITPIKSISYHTSTKYSKQIYIFGETHGSLETCKTNKCNVYDFIVNNITNIPKFIDVFLEIAYVTKGTKIEYSPGQNILHKFAYDFNNCLISEKEQCKYKNIRFHYSDIRQTRDKTLPLLIIMFIYYFLPLNKSINTNYTDLLKTLQDFKTFLIKPEHKSNIDYFNNSLKSHDEFRIYILKTFNRYKLEKQQNEIPYPEVKEMLLQYLKDKISMVKNLQDFNTNNILRIIKNIEKYKSTLISMSNKDLYVNELVKGLTTEEIKNLTTGEMEKLILKEAKKQKYVSENILELTKIIVNYIISISMPIMDVYLFARMFRNFKNVKYKYSEQAKYIVVYVGDEHAINYRELLNRLNFKEEFHKVSNYEKEDFCIDISKLKQPLFT